MIATGLLERRLNLARSDAEFISMFPQVEKFLGRIADLKKSNFFLEQKSGAMLARTAAFRLFQEILTIIVEELEGVAGYEQIDIESSSGAGRQSSTRATRKPTRHECRLVSGVPRPPSDVQRDPLRELLGDDQDHCDRRRPANIHTMVNGSRERNDVPASAKAACRRSNQGR